MVPGLSCSAACGIFPNYGSNLCPLHWQADSYPLSHQGSPGMSIYCISSQMEHLQGPESIWLWFPDLLFLAGGAPSWAKKFIDGISANVGEDS